MNPFELVKPEQAAKELNTSADTIRSAMEQNTLPFPLGFYVSHDNRSALFGKSTEDVARMFRDGKNGEYAYLFKKKDAVKEKKKVE